MIIAIDGPAGSGKGTISKKLAEYFNLSYLDTGILYRAVALQMLTDYAKEHYVNVICIGQVNKSGSMAGSQKLKHMVDAMVHLSIEKKDEDFKGLRVLETVKNRFGGSGWTFFLVI